ncbi:MAG: lipid A biosynthesis (KDO)2-(lauroyl)-lipid IVA acyltransferase [Tannerella sp.]|jgi:predicted LPLAT superfamily acyltransferase|nr:lipid A biosynthesis (KDO)2-(lauroyl)-lipid IVA acyltransferase [Tannerella sp.]
MNKSRRWKGNTGGSLWGQKALILFFRLLDIRVGYCIMACVVPFYMLFSRRACSAIYRFFRRRLGRSRLQSLAGTYRNHYAFGQVILDRFAIFAGKKRFFETEIVGNEHFRRLTDGDKGFVIAGAHVGNFEICGYLLNQEKKRIHALIYAGETKTVQENRARIFRTRHVDLIPVTDDMSHLFAVHDALRRGEIVSMSCDRNLGPAKTAACDFMGGKADFPAGAFLLAVHFEVEVLAVFVVKKSNRKYTVYVNPVEIDASATNLSKREKAEMLAQSFAGRLASVVEKHPEQWFNYYEFWK